MRTLIIHPGFTKTATTFLQNNILENLHDIDNIGKPFKNDTFFNVHKKIFNLTREDRRYFANNSAPLIKKYSNLLLEKISKSNKQLFFLSDETIFDFFSYNAELNMYLFRDVLEVVKKEDIKVIFLISIRRQDNLILSHYSYANKLWSKIGIKNFQDLIEHTFKLENSYLNSLFYSKTVSRISNILKEDIKIILQERLLLDFKNFMKIFNLEINISEQNFKPLRKNHYIKNNRKIYYTREGLFKREVKNSENEMKSLLKIYQKDNEELNDKFKLNLQKLEYF